MRVRLPYMNPGSKVSSGPLIYGTLIKPILWLEQEEMIGELTSQLARVNVLIQDGKTSTLHFITREAADEERKGIERQYEKLKETLKGKDNIIAERDEESECQDQLVSESMIILVFTEYTKSNYCRPS